MGGLRKYMPLTSLAFLIGTLAICGIPPFAGLWLVGWLTAGLTAFYMFRMYFMTFEGDFRGNDMDIRAELSAAVAPVFGPGAMDVKELEHDSEDHGHDDHGHGHSEYPHVLYVHTT